MKSVFYLAFSLLNSEYKYGIITAATAINIIIALAADKPTWLLWNAVCVIYNAGMVVDIPRYIYNHACIIYDTNCISQKSSWLVGSECYDDVYGSSSCDYTILIFWVEERKCKIKHTLHINSLNKNLNIQICFWDGFYILF